MSFRALVLLFATLLSLACAKDRSRGAGVQSSEVAPASPAPEVSVSEDMARAVSEKAAVPAPQARMIIRTASMTIVVADTERVMRELTRIVTEQGGYVAQARTWREGGAVRGHISLRLPAAQLDPMLASLRKTAVRVESENVAGEDVTEEFSDLRAQLVNLETTEVELRELLSSVRQRTQKAADVLEVYRELVKIRGEIERIKGRMQYLSQLSALATINVELVPDQLAGPVLEPGWRPAEHVVAAFRALVDALKWMAGAAIWIVVLVLPLLIVLVAPVLLLIWWLRRRKAQRRS